MPFDPEQRNQIANKNMKRIRFTSSFQCASTSSLMGLSFLMSIFFILDYWSSISISPISFFLNLGIAAVK